MNNAMYRKLALGLIAAWFVFALIASALHLYRASSGAPPLAIGLGVSIPIMIFLAWFGLSPGFRAFVLSLDAGALTRFNAWRFAGFTFLVLYAYGLLPGIFALPAGLGDMAVALTAFSAAKKFADPEKRGAFITWQILGAIDLVTAVTLGSTAGWFDPGAAAMTPISVLPLSVIPTFGVPLYLIFHIICILQARRLPEGLPRGLGEPSAA